MEISKDEISADREKCTKQHVQTVAMNVKCHLNLVLINLFIVVIVLI